MVERKPPSSVASSSAIGLFSFASYAIDWLANQIQSASKLQKVAPRPVEIRAATFS
jgi:hypothetical protein